MSRSQLTKASPQHVYTGCEAECSDDEHSYTGQEVYSTLGDRTDATSLVAPTPQKGEETERNASSTGQ
ncbi:hypothetical protein BH24ACT22_BH24ACT22_19960 [soil metagenome]